MRVRVWFPKSTLKKKKKVGQRSGEFRASERACLKEQDRRLQRNNTQGCCTLPYTERDTDRLTDTERDRHRREKKRQRKVYKTVQFLTKGSQGEIC